jgi:hypothetical protein
MSMQSSQIMGSHPKIALVPILPLITLFPSLITLFPIQNPGPCVILGAEGPCGTDPFF